MWFYIFWNPLGARPKEALPDFGVQKMAQRTSSPSFLLGWFRGAPLKSETTFENQLLILFHKCEPYELIPKNPTSPIGAIGALMNRVGPTSATHVACPGNPLKNGQGSPFTKSVHELPPETLMNGR